MSTAPHPVSRAWRRAIAEHEQVMQEFAGALGRFTNASLQLRSAPGRWSAAELTVHVCQSYELGCIAAMGGPSMRLVSPRPIAFLSRRLMLPVLLATRRFPREAPAPREVHPDRERAATLTVSQAISQFSESARLASDALLRPDAQPFTHAYFGTLAPRLTLRLLSAHTRHHRVGLLARLGTRP